MQTLDMLVVLLERLIFMLGRYEIFPGFNCFSFLTIIGVLEKNQAWVHTALHCYF